MENYYTAALGEHLIANESFIASLRNHVKELYQNNGQEVLHKEDCKAKLFLDAIGKSYYLIIDRDGLYHVYQDDATKRSEAFSFELKSLEQDSKASIYSGFIFSVSKTTPDSKEDSVNDYIRSTMGYTGNNPTILRAFKSLASSMLEVQEENFSTSPYVIKKALEFLEQQNGYNSSLGTFDYELLEQNPVLVKLVEKRLDDFSIILSFMKDVLKEHKFDKKNCFSFNDCDNHFYKQGKYMIITQQNFMFCIDYKDEKEYTIYHAISKYNGRLKKCHSITSLMNDIKGGLVNNIDHVSLEVKDGKVMFADNSALYSLDFDLVHTKNELIDEKLGVITYPVDITTFEYQYAYTKSKYQYDKMNFLMHSLFVLGNGYQYDETLGRFYSDKIYDKSVLEVLNEPDHSQDVPFGKIGYFYPKMNITKLDKDWLEALELIVEKIKREKPDTSGAYLPSGKTFEDIMTYLENVISFNKNMNNEHKNMKKSMK